MHRIVPVVVVALCAAAAADISMSGGPWRWRDGDAGLQVSARDTVLIARELIQLIDLSEGWRAVPVTAGSAAAAQAGILADGRVGTFHEVSGKLTFRREVWVQDATCHVSVRCELADPAPATKFFYSLEVPAAVVGGGAWRAQTDGLVTGALFAEPTGGAVLIEPVDTLEILAPPSVITLRAEGQGASWSFQQWRTAPHDCYRIRVELPAAQGASWSGQLALTIATSDLTPGAFLEPVRRQARERLSLARHGELAARALTCLTRSPLVGRTCEILADIDGAFEDPFDPGDISVTAHVTTPSRTYALPAFYYVPHERNRDQGTDVVTPGDPQWRVRFLPVEPGEHRVTVRVEDRSGAATTPELRLIVGRHRWQGLVRVSETNPLALARESGEGFYPLGVNIYEMTALGKPLPPERLDRTKGYIERLAAAGGNFIRLRMDSWWLAIDNPPDVLSGYMGAGKFNQRACWDIDRLMEACEEAGVQVMLCLENANATVNSPREAWRQRYNTYAADLGGPCETMSEFWTDATARELFRRKMTYCVARWGAEPSVAMWEFFNEVVIGGDAAPAPIIAWHRDMAAELKRLDPHRRIVTTSVIGARAPEARAALWALPDLDVAQVHEYTHTNTAKIYDTAQQAQTACGKPVIVGEFGIGLGPLRSGRFRHADDPEGLVAHLGRWSVAMSQAMGALDWYVANYVDALGLWDDFTLLAAFIGDLPYTDPNLEPLEVGEVQAAPGRPLPAPADVAVHPRAFWARAPLNRFIVGPDGAVQDGDALNAWLWGTQNHPDLRNPPTFIVDYPRPGRFTVRVTEVVGRGSNPVRITLDGEVALERDLACEEGRGERWEVRQPGPDGNLAVWHNTDLAVEVPAGRHEITVENLGRDRCLVEYRLQGYATGERVPDVRVLGLRHSRGAHVWMHNSSWSAHALVHETPIVPARAVAVSVFGLQDGPVQIEWWDPRTGEMLRAEAKTVVRGALALSVGQLDKDMACKILYRR